jgi:hypothetical protein
MDDGAGIKLPSRFWMQKGQVWKEEFRCGPRVFVRVARRRVDVLLMKGLLISLPAAETELLSFEGSCQQEVPGGGAGGAFTSPGTGTGL